MTSLKRTEKPFLAEVEDRAQVTEGLLHVGTAIEKTSRILSGAVTSKEAQRQSEKSSPETRGCVQLP